MFKKKANDTKTFFFFLESPAKKLRQLIGSNTYTV